MNAKKQILFVDDDELILTCFKRLLGNRYKIGTALGADRALEAIKHDSYAVVASDMRMPGMNGIELLRKIKETSPEIVGILLTGNPEFQDSGGLESDNGYFRRIAKPCPTADLVAAIEEALEQYSLNTQVSTQ